MPNIKRYLHPNLRFLWFLPLLLVLGFGLRRSFSAPPSDFAGYYYGGKALLHGQYAVAYDMTALNDRIASDGHTGVMVSYSPFPPFTALVFAPFLGGDMHTAKILFNVLSIGLFLFTLLRITRAYGTPPYLILALPFAFLIPLINNLAFGQAYLLLFTLLAEGWLAYRKERRILAAALWAAAILFKLFPAFLFVFLLLRKKIRQTFLLGIACALLLLLSIWLNGFAAWKYYISVIIPRMGHGELNDSFTYVFQSAYMLLKRAFQYDGLLNPHPVVYSPWLFTIGMALFKAAILSAAAWLTLLEKDEFFPFSVWIAASMLVSPNGSSYSLVLLILPLLALASRIPAHSRYRTFNFTLLAAILLLTAACAISVGSFGHYLLLLQFPRLYLLLLFYALLALQGRPASNPALFGVLTVFFILVDIRGNLPKKDSGTYVLSKEAHLFICDYSVLDHRLIYTWRDDKGRHIYSTGLPIASQTDDGVALRDNQIWYRGRQLTNTPDQKAKPTLINGAEVYYLSDANRGFGFYTLREIRPAAIPPGDGATPGSSQ